MREEELNKARRTASIVSAAVTGAVFFYALIVEAAVRHPGLTPPLTGAAAAAARYGLYFWGAASVLAVRFVRPLIEARGKALGPAGTMAAQSAAAAALCEVPALAGLMIFFLTGGYWDFYLLAVFSTVMEIYHFPRSRDWAERAVNRRGPLT